MDEIDFGSLENVTTESLEQELAKIDPAELRYLSQLLSENVPAVKKIIRNALEEPIPETTKKRLRLPLQPKPYQPTAPPRKRNKRQQQLLKQFDPIKPSNIRNVTNYRNEIMNLYDDIKFDGEEKSGRRYKRWRIIKDLNKDQTAKFMDKIRREVRTSFFTFYIYAITLRNIEDGTFLTFYQAEKRSQRMNKLEDAEKWIRAKEAARLEIDNIERPDTKWIFDHFFAVDVRVVLDRQPLLGTGPLPDWLRKQANTGRKQAMVALDTYRDNLCLWRCIAVHKGARSDRSTEAARSLAKSFFKLRETPTNCVKTSLDEIEKVEMHLNKGVAVSGWLGIRVYIPERLEDKQVVWHLIRNPSPKLKNIMTIGIYGEHAFLIKDITKLAKTYECNHCHARFTKVSNLQRHADRCAQGETVIDCPGEKVEAPQSAYQKAFYPRHKASKESIQWLEYVAKHWKMPIAHAMSGHGGERWVENRPVDGYNHERKLVLQYHGCYWHGCPKCYRDRNTVIEHCGRTREELYQATKRRTAYLRKKGYRVIECWACEVGDKYVEELPEAKTKSYPHAILYDFEAYGDKNQRKELTDRLTIENVHVPVSVSIGDTHEREPTHICEKDPTELIRKFAEELERRGKNIRKRVRDEYMPADITLLPKDQKKKIEEWCDQVPVLGFNSGKYDLNLIKAHFVKKLADTTSKVRVAKNSNKIMFLLTSGFRFLDIMNYLGPGTSYEKWVKAYDCETTKSWLPYEWFDDIKKLDYPGLPDYPDWYSNLKGGFTLKLTEWKACKRTFWEEGMKTFKDWVRYYNNLDVAPGLEALEKMRNFYTEKGIDIMKDAVSIPGVSLHYLLKGAIERNAELYAPSKEAYEMLKGAVVGGPSLVFTRYHEVGKTRIRSHQVAEPKLCQNILGYDANALYLSTMLKEMPCGKERVEHYDDDMVMPMVLTQNLKEGSWFGFAEVDIEIPKHLHPKFEEMCPFFYNKVVPAEAVPEHMIKYLADTGRNRGDGRKLVGAMSAQRILLYAPLLKWYINHGAEITKVYRTIDYKPVKIFPWFVEQVTEARRTGDVEKSKALLADIFKLLGNSGYGKLIEALERQTNVIYTKDEKVVDRALRSAYFANIGEIGAAYELESRKPRITIRRPFQIGISVYQLAKLRMLEFYYDFLDRYIDRKDFELIQMDTDSNYMAISGKKLEDIVKPELREEFEKEKKNWLAWDKWSGRTPGLFKQEFAGERMIALCSKCYYADDRGEKQKLSTKGMSKNQNEINWYRFKAALEGNKDMATNRGFRMRGGKIVTYEQKKLGLSAYYDKRWVLPDGIHTEPIEYHQRNFAE